MVSKRLVQNSDNCLLAVSGNGTDPIQNHKELDMFRMCREQTRV